MPTAQQQRIADLLAHANRARYAAQQTTDERHARALHRVADGYMAKAREEAER
jgi:hypothetical protein